MRIAEIRLLKRFLQQDMFGTKSIQLIRKQAAQRMAQSPSTAQFAELVMRIRFRRFLLQAIHMVTGL